MAASTTNTAARYPSDDSIALDREAAFVQAVHSLLSSLRKNWSKCPHLTDYADKMELAMALAPTNSVRRDGVQKVTASLVSRGEPYRGQILNHDLSFLTSLEDEPFVKETTLIRKWRAIATATRFADLRRTVAVHFKDVYAKAWSCVHGQDATDALLANSPHAIATRAEDDDVDMPDVAAPHGSENAPLATANSAEMVAHAIAMFFANICHSLVAAVGRGWSKTPETELWASRLKAMCAPTNTDHEPAVQLMSSFAETVAASLDLTSTAFNMTLVVNALRGWPLAEALNLRPRWNAVNKPHVSSRGFDELRKGMETNVHLMCVATQWRVFYAQLPQMIRDKLVRAGRASATGDVFDRQQLMVAVTQVFGELTDDDKPQVVAAFAKSGMSSVDMQFVLSMVQTDVFGPLL